MPNGYGVNYNQTQRRSKMKKYRIRSWDIVNNLYMLEEQVFWFIWKFVGLGEKEKLKKIIKDLEEEGE